MRTRAHMPARMRVHPRTPTQMRVRVITNPEGSARACTQNPGGSKQDSLFVRMFRANIHRMHFHLYFHVKRQ